MMVLGGFAIYLKLMQGFRNVSQIFEEKVLVSHYNIQNYRIKNYSRLNLSLRLC